MRTPYNSLLARLWLLDGAKAVKILVKDNEVLMRKVNKNVAQGAKINEYWESRLADALHHDGAVYITYSEGSYFLTPVEPSEPESQGVLVYKLRVGKTCVGCYQFGQLLTSDRAGLAKALFGDINSYTMGRAILWDLEQQEQQTLPSHRASGEHEFQVESFLAAGPHYRMNKICGVAFYHSEVGFINGIKELRERFPTATIKEVRQLYRVFGLTPSTHVGEIFKERDPERDLIKEYNLRPYKDGGIIIASKYQQLDIIANNPSDLLRHLKEDGETELRKKQVNDLWKKVTGKGWKA